MDDELAALAAELAALDGGPTTTTTTATAPAPAPTKAAAAPAPTPSRVPVTISERGAISLLAAAVREVDAALGEQLVHARGGRELVTRERLTGEIVAHIEGAAGGRARAAELGEALGVDGSTVVAPLLATLAASGRLHLTPDGTAVTHDAAGRALRSALSTVAHRGVVPLAEAAAGLPLSLDAAAAAFVDGGACVAAAGDGTGTVVHTRAWAARQAAAASGAAAARAGSSGTSSSQPPLVTAPTPAAAASAASAGVTRACAGASLAVDPRWSGAPAAGSSSGGAPAAATSSRVRASLASLAATGAIAVDTLRAAAGGGAVADALVEALCTARCATCAAAAAGATAAPCAHTLTRLPSDTLVLAGPLVEHLGVALRELRAPPAATAAVALPVLAVLPPAARRDVADAVALLNAAGAAFSLAWCTPAAIDFGAAAVAGDAPPLMLSMAPTSAGGGGTTTPPDALTLWSTPWVAGVGARALLRAVVPPSAPVASLLAATSVAACRTIASSARWSDASEVRGATEALARAPLASAAPAALARLATTFAPAAAVAALDAALAHTCGGGGGGTGAAPLLTLPAADARREGDRFGDAVPRLVAWLAAVGRALAAWPAGGARDAVLRVVVRTLGAALASRLLVVAAFRAGVDAAAAAAPLSRTGGRGAGAVKLAADLLPAVDGACGDIAVGDVASSVLAFLPPAAQGRLLCWLRDVHVEATLPVLAVAGGSGGSGGAAAPSPEAAAAVPDPPELAAARTLVAVVSEAAAATAGGGGVPPSRLTVAEFGVVADGMAREVGILMPPAGAPPDKKGDRRLAAAQRAFGWRLAAFAGRAIAASAAPLGGCETAAPPPPHLEQLALAAAVVACGAEALPPAAGVLPVTLIARAVPVTAPAPAEGSLPAPVIADPAALALGTLAAVRPAALRHPPLATVVRDDDDGGCSALAACFGAARAAAAASRSSEGVDAQLRALLDAVAAAAAAGGLRRDDGTLDLWPPPPADDDGEDGVAT